MSEPERSEYTKIVLELAPRVAEIMGPWEPEEGDWCVDGHQILVRSENLYYFKGLALNPFPPLWLPTLTQCLDWLQERSPDENIEVGIYPDKVFVSYCQFVSEGETALESAYRCVIAVGEEK